MGNSLSISFLSQLVMRLQTQVYIHIIQNTDYAAASVAIQFPEHTHMQKPFKEIHELIKKNIKTAHRGYPRLKVLCGSSHHGCGNWSGSNPQITRTHGRGPTVDEFQK